MRLRRAGRSALLIECRDGEQVEAWRAELLRRRESGELTATDIVPGARTVLLDGVPPETADLLAGWPEPDAAATAEGPLVEIPVAFDGEDLPDVAERWGVTADEAVNRLLATPLTVAFCGFAPGFAYLRGLPEEWAVPRLDAPRPRVPAGAVGLAGAYAGIYPTASPGGWRLVGHTGKTLFDVRAQPPALLGPGTRVRLAPA
jgi:KipI family sensor histidine kinase inhibitor